ncbi:unnamed protein product [Angiostrongylus costaricensis]|uniref:PHD-type domain-containing protein n=1 Tax=Angiostrongylus costaricensis TaxID=334426 RepID=A0A158PJS7_ANGCS|nr:unnamed protein product [Angiostrongylus costaricensis]
MDESSLKFRPIPCDISKSLYERILRGSQKVRAREGQKNAAKAEELSRPENVYRMKVACNFLMELIDRERHSQDKDSVSWQSIQKRYEHMVSEVDRRDEDLMNKYKCFGLDFTERTLNSEVVKKLTCRSSITKALNQAVFYGIHYDNSSNVLMVGLNENARLYSEEELKKAAEACETSSSPNAAKSVYGRPSTPNQSSLVVPRSGEHPQNVRDNSMGTHMFQRECHEDSMPEVLESSARAPSAPKAGLSNRTFAQPKYSNGTAHHRSAFGVSKAASTSEERESNWEKSYDDGVQHMASSSHHATKMNELYDRERNAGFHREFVHRSSNEQYQEEQRSRRYYDYAEGRFDPNLSNNSRTGDDSRAYLYQTCNPYAIEMDNSDKKILQYKPCSVFDKCLDEETVINHENFRRSFGSGANVEKNVCNISNEMKGSEFANMSSTSDSKYKQRTGLHKSDRCYSEELVQRSQRSFRNSSPYEVRTNSGSSTCQSGQNDTLRESTLSSEESVCLRMIRDFAYVYRNPTTHGFRTLENVVNLLPRKSVDYWIPLIQSHLPEVEIGAFHNAIPDYSSHEGAGYGWK